MTSIVSAKRCDSPEVHIVLIAQWPSQYTNTKRWVYMATQVNMTPCKMLRRTPYKHPKTCCMSQICCLQHVSSTKHNLFATEMVANHEWQYCFPKHWAKFWIKAWPSKELFNTDIVCFSAQTDTANSSKGNNFSYFLFANLGGVAFTDYSVLVD